MSRKKQGKLMSNGKEVKTMANMPGFTAQASLYSTSERYAGLGDGLSETTGSQAVIPQFCFWAGPCLPLVHKRLRICCGWTGCSHNWYNC